MGFVYLSPTKEENKVSIVDRAEKELVDYIKSMKEPVEVTGNHYHYNQKCHMNSVHYARVNKESKIAMLIYIDGISPVVHFVNVDCAGNFLCNTLGTFIADYDCYFIRYIKEAEFDSINTIFEQAIEEMKKQLSWWTRLWIGEKRFC